MRETGRRSPRSLNGWRRLWLALTGLAAMVAVVVGFIHGSDSGSSWTYASALRQDFANPACRDTATKPFNELIEPEFSSDGGSCWHIYTHRRYQSDPNRALTDYQQHFKYPVSDDAIWMR